MNLYLKLENARYYNKYIIIVFYRMLDFLENLV